MWSTHQPLLRRNGKGAADSVKRFGMLNSPWQFFVTPFGMVKWPQLKGCLWLVTTGIKRSQIELAAWRSVSWLLGWNTRAKVIYLHIVMSPSNKKSVVKPMWYSLTKPWTAWNLKHEKHCVKRRWGGTSNFSIMGEYFCLVPEDRWVCCVFSIMGEHEDMRWSSLGEGGWWKINHFQLGEFQRMGW